MVRVVRLLLLLLVFSGLLPHRGQAAQFLAGELTYEHLYSPAGVQNRYLMRLRVFRDCAGAGFNPTETLSCRVGSAQTACASTDSRNFTATLTRTNLTIVGHPYCTINPIPTANQCNPNAPFNYEETYYEALVTLPPAPEWLLSWEGGTRAGLANLQNAATQPLRLEATLRNELLLVGATQPVTINNTSAQYLNQDLSTQMVLQNQRTTLTFSAFEADGDSLVYTLATPMVGCNQPATYQTFAPSSMLPLPATPGQTCQASLPTGSATAYSAHYPVSAFQLSGNCPLRTATPNFSFHATLGSFTFTPVGYFPESTPADRARNQYAVVGKVTEYRKIGGQYYEVGSVSRNLLVAVIDLVPFQFANHAARIDPTKLVNGQAQPLTDTVRVGQGQTVRVVLTTSDPDGAHHFRFTALPLGTYPHVLPTGAYQVNTSLLDRVELVFTPPATLPPGTYTGTTIAENDNCPARDRLSPSVTFRVTAPALGTAGPAKPLLTTAAPNPFTDAVTFRVSGLTGPTQLTVTNVLGQTVAELALRPAAGAAEITWRVAGPLPAGVYLARVAGTGQTLRLLRR